MLAVLHLPLSPAVENSLFELNRLTMQHGSKVIGSLERFVRIDETSENGEETFWLSTLLLFTHHTTTHRTDGG
jgi:hypothetical protein